MLASGFRSSGLIEAVAKGLCGLSVPLGIAGSTGESKPSHVHPSTWALYPKARLDVAPIRWLAQMLPRFGG